MKAQHILIGIVALILLVVGVTFPQGGTTIINRDGEPTGATSGPDHYNHQYFYTGMSEGGVLTLATTTNVKLTNNQIADVKVISLSAAASPAITITTPASSTWASLPQNGLTQSWVIDNLHTAAATTSTIVAGTGVDIDGTGANDDVINGGVSGTLECFRLPSSNIRCIVQEFVDAG